MKLLLLVVVCAVCPHSVVPKPRTQVRRDLHAYPYEVSSPDGLKKPVKSVLYSYSVDNNPYNANIRHYGQNSEIPNSVVEIAEIEEIEEITNQYSNSVIRGVEESSVSTAFNKAHVQAFPSVGKPEVFTYDAKTYEEDQLDSGDIPLRTAVESIPIEAEVYSHLRNPDESSDNLQFSREGVESLPFFPTPYTGGFNDVDRNAFVVKAGGNFGQVGNRASVESHPIIDYSFDPDDAPGQVQRNARPYGQLSEKYAEGRIPDVNYEENFVQTYSNPRSTEKKLVCYFGGWSVYRPKPFDFAVTDIDPFSCTHIIYSFAGLDDATWGIKSLDPELDIVQGAYKAAIGLKMKNPNLKVMIAIGGWTEGGKKYSEMASKKERRDAFVASVISFMEEHQWDGLDLDWEYPGASDRGGRFSDKANFAALVSELSAEFKTRGWLLTAAVSSAGFRVNEGYDVAKIAQDLDYIFVMTYDLRGSWDGKADHHSPLSSRDTDAWAFKSLNTKDGLNYWHKKGAPMHKLLMGIPFYGRSFTLSSTSNTKPGAQAKSGGNEGKYSQERGFLAYYEICQDKRNGGWAEARDSVGGPYMVKGDQWVGYDDTEYIATKMEAVHSMGLGGAFVWAIDLDDNLGVCGDKWPLLNTMRKGLFGTTTVVPPTPTGTTPTSIAPPTPTGTTPTTSRPAETETPTTAGSTGSTGTTAPVTVINYPDEIPCQEGSYSLNPDDCSGYFLCVHGVWGPYNCPDGLYWDHNANRCDWPQNVKCERPPTAATDGPISPTPPIIPPTPTITQKPVTPVTTVTPPGELSGDYKVVCYFTNWAWYRPGIGKYTPDDIDPSVCTHVVYGFAVLDYGNLVIKPHDTWADFDNKFYEKVTALRARGIKVTIAIGGWNDSAGDKYSRLVNNPAARAKFITHVMEFIQTHNFDGLDLDWEYPVCWQVDCSKGPAGDKEGFSNLVKELSAAFKPRGLLLSAAVSPSKKVIDAGYDVPVLSAYMDWIAVMTYDFHGHWDKKTGHVAPMSYHPEADYDYFNMDSAIRYWHEKGAAKNKLVLGMPLYGQSFTLNDPANTGLNSPARSGGQAGQFTRAKGFLAYYEICQNVAQGWTVVQDPEGRMGPYAYSGNQWVSYDDVAMIKKKSQYIRDMGLAGGMVWALDLDDFTNRCGQGKSPLMNTIKAVLGPAKSISGPPIEKPMKQNETEVATPIDITTEETITIVTTEPPSVPDEYKVVCYFTNWAWYRQGEGKYTPDDIDPSLCTHIVYGFAVLDNDKLLIKPHDTWADYDNKFYEKVTALKNAPNKPKVLVAIGGWNDSAGSKYSRLVNNPAARAKFNAHVIQFIQNNNFDGLDLDWEYPVCWQVNCEKGPASDKEAFAAWVYELHVAFKPHGLLLSAAVSPSNKVIAAGYDVPTVSKYLDWVAVMTYDYHGQWDKKTGHVAPMYAHSEDDNLAFNTNYTIHYWIENGANPKKLVMGLPMYGQSFSLASASNNGLNQKSYGGGQAGPYTRARGFLAYYEICHFIQNQAWTVVRDPENSMGPYAHKGGQWVGFDDIPMIRYKSEYIKKMGLGGGMIWALDLDDFRNRCGCEAHPLLKTINRVLRGTHGQDPGCAILGGGTRMPIVPNEIESSQRPVQETLPVKIQIRAPQCEGGDYKPSPTDCTKFYQCNQNQWEERTCFPGLHWNPAPANQCDWPNNAKCPIGQPPATGLPTPPTVTSRPITRPTPRPTRQPTTWTQGTTKNWNTPYVPWVKPRPSTTIGPPITTPDTGFKVVCYFTNWAWYRQGAGKYRPDDIDAELCTHVVYGFAVLDANRLLIKPHDTWADYDNYFYEKVTNLRKRGVKVTLAIGGWNDSLGPKYSKLVNNPAARARFTTHVIEFLLKHNFDGLDLDWEYPKCWQVDCKKGPASDKTAFSAWIRELHTAFQPYGLLLSAAVSPSNKVIDAGYEVPELNKYLDWIAVMTYDYHGHWDKQTGHVAPMYHHTEGPNAAFNANFTINYWRELGADPKKLIVGMPTYGQAFSLNNPAVNGLNAPAKKGTAGKHTRAAGFLAYYEICDKIRNEGYTVVNDPTGSMGPYAYKGNQWVGYDDIAMIRHKSEWIKENGYGGGMIWALDLDDFRGNCGCGTHPLLRTINQVLRNIPGPPAGCGL